MSGRKYVPSFLKNQTTPNGGAGSNVNQFAAFDDDFDASKSTLPSLMAQFGKKIDDANVDDYFEKVKNLTKQYLKKQK